VLEVSSFVGGDALRRELPAYRRRQYVAIAHGCSRRCFVVGRLLEEQHLGLKHGFGKLEFEHRPPASTIVGEITVHEAGKVVCDIQAESDGLGLAVIACRPMKRFEDVALMARRNTATVVGNGQSCSPVVVTDSYLDLITAVARRIAEQAPNDLS
jgi:hypothetical protein